MSIVLRPLCLSLGFATLCAAMPAAWAQHHGGGRGFGPPGGGPPAGMQAPPPMQMQMPRRADRQDDSLSDSVRRVERDTGGQVLSAERMQSDGRDINRIKVVDGEGRVRVYMDDPQSRGRTQRIRDNDD